MSALPLPLAQALRAFSPPQESEAASLRRQLDALRSDWQSLLRLPFEVEFESPGTYGLAPEDSEPPSYRYVTADDDDVRDAVDALIDRHIVELEADVKRRMKLRGG
ncbi:MAG TPA: hypothetical protein VN612_13895 [Acidobacteriaceae bacterium]|nr:hypothetical protein [Acidobacteriaceae bacterium]